MLTTAWNEVDFGQVATLQRGYDLPSRARKRGIVPVVTSTGITDSHAEARERAPGVVTGRYGTIGEVFFIEEDYWPHNTTLFVKNFHGNDPLFVSYLLRTIDFQSHSGKSGVPGVNRNDLHALRVSIPPTVAEQRAIAGALRDVDALIGALDQLIAKKRDLKQETMQQLLTGQTRLPSFSRKWEIHALGESITLLSGHHVLAQYCNSRGVGVPYLTGPADFLNGQIQHRKFTERPTTLCAPGDILVTVKGSGSGSLIVADGAYCISRQLMAIRVRDWHGRFIYYSLLQNASKIKAASTGLIPGLSRSDILEQTLPLPSDFSEQTAIAEVLSDMDAELAALEQRRDKTRDLKQGMMQELLTGRTRLV
jgi:type I restriction enzyme, S subunit